MRIGVIVLCKIIEQNCYFQETIPLFYILLEKLDTIYNTLDAASYLFNHLRNLLVVIHTCILIISVLLESLWKYEGYVKIRNNILNESYMK